MHDLGRRGGCTSWFAPGMIVLAIAIIILVGCVPPGTPPFPR